MSAYEYMAVYPPWRPLVRVLVEPNRELPIHGDPRALSAAAALRARRAREGDPFVGPVKVPEVINRVCDASEGPGTLPRLHARAVEQGWQAVVTHGRGWTLGRLPALVDSYALRLRGRSVDGSDVRMFGLWINGQAQYGGWLVVGNPLGPSRLTITALGELINSVRLR